MFPLTIKELLAHKMRLLTTAFAVLLGVAFMAGTLVFTDTLTATFDNVLADANAGVDAMVARRVGRRRRLRTGRYRDRRRCRSTTSLGVDGVARTLRSRSPATPRSSDADGEAVGDQAQAPAFGLNWIDTSALNPYLIVDGTPPSTDDEIVIDQRFGRRRDFELGDTATVLTQRSPVDLTISGIAKFGSADSPAGRNGGVVHRHGRAAVPLVARPGRRHRGPRRSTASRRRAGCLGSSASIPDVEVITGATLVAEDQAALHEAFGPFKVFLLVFAFVAVFVGAFIINNTFSITVAQRTKQMAMLRALGASRRQVLRSVMTEAVAIGVAGSAAGLVAGIGVAAGLKAMFVAIGVELPDGPMVISPGSMLASAAVGMIVTVLSAWLPARRAGRVPPMAALRELSVDRTGSSRRRPVIGCLVTAIGVALLLAGLGGSGIELVGLGALVAFVGVAVLGPVLARPVIGAFGVVVNRRGVSGEMAIRNAMPQPEAHRPHRFVADDRCRPRRLHHRLRGVGEDVLRWISGRDVHRHPHRRLGRVRRARWVQPRAGDRDGRQLTGCRRQ